jgi:universal stress protein A
MLPYQRILAAVDLRQDSRTVAARACEIAASTGGVVQLLHVAQLVAMEPMGDMPLVQIDDQMLALARRQIEALASELGLPVGASTVEAGSARSEILRHAREHNIDLIVIGCRERHGLSLLLHRSEGSLLQAAPCDVLAVRVR